MCAAAVTTNATAGRTARQLSRRPGLSRTTSSTSRPVTEAANAALAIPGAAAGLGFLYPRSRCGRCMTHNDRPRPAGTATTTVTSIRTTSGMSARLTTTPPWITMQAAVVGAFMIVGSFGHYSAQTAHDHGPPAASHEYPVTLCRSMHKHAQRATPAIRQIRTSVGRLPCPCLVHPVRHGVRQSPRRQVGCPERPPREFGMCTDRDRFVCA
jgi:hypothetical protein